MKKDIRFRKYEFDSKSQADILINKLDNDTIGLVRLGNIVVTPEQRNEEDEIIVESVISDKYSVDVFWKVNELESWNSYRISLNGAKGSHTFSGYEYED